MYTIGIDARIYQDQYKDKDNEVWAVRKSMMLKEFLFN